MLWVLLWFVLSMVVGFWAMNRGRSIILYFFISLIFSPIVGALVVFFLPSVARPPIPFFHNPMDEEPKKGPGNKAHLVDSRLCPACETELPLSMVLCINCGREVAPPSQGAWIRQNCSACDKPIYLQDGQKEYTCVYCNHQGQQD
ncbi:MAG: hypothetical protein HQL54_10110 [Magnetococcales bacterium]|nr:hypothetical protein [Magnetococcales bacterium]